MKKRILAMALSLCALFSIPSSSVEANAAANQLNVLVHFDTTTVSQYGVPGAFLTRFPVVADRVSDFYSEFGININFKDISSGSRVTIADIDTCLKENGNVDFDKICAHTTDELCSNSGNLHHTNGYAVMRFIRNNYSYYSDQTACLFLTCGKVCLKSESNTHLKANGQAFPIVNFMVVQDDDYTEYDTVLGDTTNINRVSKTLAHEIGHLYNVEDDYLNLHYDSRDYCIWGYYRNLPMIRDNLVVCPSCQIILEDSAGKFNHT